jgi:hypothetical protein
MGIWDFLTADYATRQQRTRDLNDRLGGLLNYYLGPTGIPNRLSSANALLNPIDQIGEAGANTVVAFDPTRSKQDRIQAALNAGIGTITAAAPAVAGRLASQPVRQTLMETIAGTSGQADVAPPVRADEPRGILAYQGSPHDFNAERLVRYPDGRTEYIVGRPDVLPDVPAGAEVLRDFPMGRMRMDKIGTGEGAQAYGYGLYAAEAEPVARGYRDQLSQGNAAAARRTLEAAGGDVDRAISETEAKLRRLDERAAAGDFGGDERRFAAQRQIQQDKIAQLRAFKETGEFNAGRLYEVNIDAKPEDFLDWDKPFASADDVERFAARFDAVDPALRKRIEDFGYMRQQMGQPMPDGNDIIREVMGGIGSKDAARASETMREAGIAGIRYLDAGSRGAGDGSRNYVVFDENLINIVRKYGIAGAAAMLGVSTMDVEQAMAQGAQPQSSGLLSPMEQ